MCREMRFLGSALLIVPIGGIYTICQFIIDPSDTHIFLCSFSITRKGDYYRYLTEITQGEERKVPAKEALNAYKEAQKAAEELSSTHPIRLGLALNFSVFYYEIFDAPDEACRLAKKAFDGAVGDLDKSNESQYKESTLILQLLRDNLTLWTSEMQEEGKESQRPIKCAFWKRREGGREGFGEQDPLASIDLYL